MTDPQLLDLKIADLLADTRHSGLHSLPHQAARGCGSEVDNMRRWTLLIALVFLAACSKNKDIDKPAALVSFSSTLKVDKVWTA